MRPKAEVLRVAGVAKRVIPRNEHVQLMAAALLGSVPVAIIYSFFVEHYVAGLTAGAVKQ